MKIKSLKLMVSSVLFGATAVLTGCASNASISGMTYYAKPVNNDQLKEKIYVKQISGGHETNPLWTSQISDENFHTALSDSLKMAELYSNQASAKYNLEADLIKVDQSYFGIDMTVNMVVNYTLEDKATGANVLKKKIISGYTATFGESIIGAWRLQKANEGAARENIKAFINYLAGVNIKPGQIAIKTN